MPLKSAGIAKRSASLLLHRSAAMATALVCSISAPAFAAAQDAATSSDKAKDNASSSGEIVISAARPTVETSIDRKSYSIAHDLQASSGAAVDVLRNVPSITVDVDGNPSLRGDANVQILIDGRPAPQFNNGNRGAALQALGADGIDRIEVLTNPPANFKPDGSAGVINIITKRRTSSRTATAQASLGSSGRFNLGGTGGAQFGKLNLHGSATLRHDIRRRLTSDARTTHDPVTGAFLASSDQHIVAGDDRLSEIASLGADYDLSKVDRLSAEGSYNRRTDNSSFNERDTVLNAAGTPTRQTSRVRPGDEIEVNNSVSLRFHHDIDKSGNGLTVLAQRSQTWERQSFSATNMFALPPLASNLQTQDIFLDQVTREFSIDYTTPLPGDAKFVTGYNLQRDDNLFDNAQSLPVAAGGAFVPDPNFTNVFRYGQTVQAFYGSYERPFGKWTVLAGLRLEQTNIQTNQVTSAQRGRQSYFRAYPNLHLTRKVGDHQTLSFGYGQRVIRPDPEDLNPYSYQQDAFTYRQGNPNLRPQEIQSLEAGWSYSSGSTSRSATLFLRRSRNGFTIVNTALTPTIVLITEENLGKSMSGGLELAASGKLLRRVDYNLSGTIYYNRIDAANLGFSGTRSAIGYDAKAAINWRVTNEDTAQFNLGTVGKRLTPQGNRRGYIAVDLGYRHQFRPNLSATATLSDVFVSRREGLIVDTPSLSEVSSRRQTGRIATIGLSWSLPGAKKKASDKFEYEK